MSQRAVSADEVLDVLSRPDGQVNQSMDKVVFYKRIVGRQDNLIAVVAVAQAPGDRFEVLTVMNHFQLKKRGTP